MSISNGDPQNDLENSIDEAFAAYLQLIDQADYTKIESFLAAHEQIAEQLQELIATASTVKSMANGSNEMLQRGATDSADHFATIAHNPTNSGSDSLQDQHSPDKKVQPGDKVQLVGEYELIEVLGRGGMGVVYKARQKSMNRFVALKMISSGGYPSEKSVRRFYQEARAAGKLSHPNIVRGFAAGEHDGRHFFAMELVEGRTLRNILKSAQQHLPTNTIASYAKVLAEAVHYAHENGILHRDLKPSNIMIDTKDRPKIADFGLAKHVDPEGETTLDSSSGSVVGTPSYMSPEQASSSNDQIGPASDVYSLGAILYELLTGEPPFKDESPLATLLLVVNQDVIPPSQLNPDCDRDLEAICLTCLNKDPQARYSTCEQLAADFGRYLAGEPVRAQRLTGPKKLWYWLREMPLVAYCTRRKQNSAHRAQHLTQWAAILTLLVGFAAYIAMPSIIERAYLQQVEIGVGNMNGAYHLLADQITPQAQPIFSKGCEECLAKLLNYEVDLGILQANTKSKQQSAGLDPVAIVAPLYQEAILVICRKTAKIASARELAGKAIALGEPGSGVRVTSDEILDKLGIQTQPQFQDSAWAALTENNSLDGAIVTASLKDSRLAKLLGTGQFRVVPLQQHELPSNVRPHRFQLDEWPPGAEHLGVVDSGTVDAVLVTRRTAPAWFVKRTLTTMYGKRNTSLSTAGKVRIADQLDQAQLIMSPKDAAGWSIGRSLHPAAREFFAPTNLGDAPHETQ